MKDLTIFGIFALGFALLAAVVFAVPYSFIEAQRCVDVTRCAGGPPDEKTDLKKYRARVAECERFYAEEKP